MTKNQLILYSIITVMIFGGVYLLSSIQLSVPDKEIEENHSPNSYDIKSAGNIPFDYYQEIEIGENYIYNVTTFGADSVWTEFSGGSTDWKTNAGRQIFVNFTGFFNRDPDDTQGDTFPDVDMPWINISIFQSGPLLNYTNANVSNSEVSRNLKLGFADFQPGFLLTVNHTDWIKANATLEANGASGPRAILTMEETYNFYYFRFEQYGSFENQKTELIYDKNSGLLVWTKTDLGDYDLEIFLEDYNLDFNRQYIYNVNNWGKDGYTHAFWWGFHSFEGVFATNPGGKIYINFNGFYGRDPNDWGDVFSDDQIVWFNISFEYKGDYGSFITFEYDNTSNPEAALIMNLKYNNFASGFLVPGMDNETWLKEKALEQADPGGSYDIPGVVTIEETDLTIKITYIEIDGPQILSLRYEKRTGLLLWTDSISKNYRLTMTIENYSSPSKPVSIISDDDDDDDDEKEDEVIFSFPILVLISIVIPMAIILTLKINREIKKNY